MDTGTIKETTFEGVEMKSNTSENKVWVLEHHEPVKCDNDILGYNRDGWLELELGGPGALFVVAPGQSEPWGIAVWGHAMNEVHPKEFEGVRISHNGTLYQAEGISFMLSASTVSHSTHGEMRVLALRYWDVTHQH